MWVWDSRERSEQEAECRLAGLWHRGGDETREMDKVTQSRRENQKAKGSMSRKLPSPVRERKRRPVEGFRKGGREKEQVPPQEGRGPGERWLAEPRSPDDGGGVTFSIKEVLGL